MKSICATALIFALLGAASRYHFRGTETRWQIAAFVAAAGIAEIGWAVFGMRSSWLRFALVAGAAASAIVFVKYHVEPHALHADATHAARLVRSSAREVLR